MTTEGHNSTLSESDRRVLFAHFHRKDLALELERKRIAEDKKANRQNAKAVGFTSAKLDHYLKSFLAEDQQKPVDKLRDERQNLEWLGLIPATTGKDLLAQVDRVDGEAMIRAKGHHAGLTGMDRVSGYDGGSSDDKLWLEAYDLGRQEYETKLPEIWSRIEQMSSKEEPEPDGDDPFEGGDE